MTRNLICIMIALAFAIYAIISKIPVIKIIGISIAAIAIIFIAMWIIGQINMKKEKKKSYWKSCLG